jgi:hypothetical protein
MDKHEPEKKDNPSESGVGNSDLRRGENIQEQDGKEAGRYDTGTKGKTDRPTGKSTPRDSTGITPAQKH